MQIQIQIIENHSGDVLYEFPPEEWEKAYATVTFLEENGMDVSLRGPTILQTLAAKLGGEDQRIKDFEESVSLELEEHGDCYQEEGEGCASQ